MTSAIDVLRTREQAGESPAGDCDDNLAGYRDFLLSREACTTTHYQQARAATYLGLPSTSREFEMRVWQDMQRLNNYRQLQERLQYTRRKAAELTVAREELAKLPADADGDRCAAELLVNQLLKEVSGLRQLSVAIASIEADPVFCKWRLA